MKIKKIIIIQEKTRYVGNVLEFVVIILVKCFCNNNIISGTIWTRFVLAISYTLLLTPKSNESDHNIKCTRTLQQITTILSSTLPHSQAACSPAALWAASPAPVAAHPPREHLQEQQWQLPAPYADVAAHQNLRLMNSWHWRCRVRQVWRSSVTSLAWRAIRQYYETYRQNHCHDIISERLLQLGSDS